jgi:periplasmic mercuric ion binding protein
MKHVIFLAALFFLSSYTQAQVMQQKAQWATINVPQLKCWVCKERLEQYLLKEKGPSGDAGIIKWTINMNAGTMRIQYVPERMTLNYIRVAINNAGFDADTTKATEDAYKILPPVCKRKEDGGGPQKGKPCNIPPEQQ